MKKLGLLVGSLAALAFLVVGGAWPFAQEMPKDHSSARKTALTTVVPPAATITSTLGIPSAIPSAIPVNTPTTVTVTAEITDSRLISGSVNLLRFGATGTQPTVIGALHDDGIAGDAIAGDHIFTTLITLAESNPSPVQLQVSAAFQGLLKRETSSPFAVIVTGMTLANMSTLSPVIVDARVSSLSSYYINGFIFSDMQLTILQAVKGAPASPIVVRVAGGTIGNVTQLALGSKPFSVGQEVFILLGGPGADGKYTVPNGPLGIFFVQLDPTYGKIAIVDPAYDSLELAYPLDASFTSLLQQSVKQQLTLADLISALSVK
jgi:hypothetical protein